MLNTLRKIKHRLAAFHWRGSGLEYMWNAMGSLQLQAVLNAVLGLVQVALSLALVWAMKNAIDIAAAQKEGNLVLAVGVMATIILCDFGVRIAQVWVRNILGVLAQNRMQQDILRRLLRQDWQAMQLRHSGDVMNRLEQDVKTIVDFLAETLPGAISTLALFLGAFCYLYSMDATLASVAVAIVPVFILFSKVYMGRMRRLTHEVREEDSRVQSILQETVQNTMLIKTMEGDRMMLGKLEDTQSSLRQKVKRRTVFSLFSNITLNLGFSVGYLVTFLWSALRLQAGTLTFGGMTAFLQLINRIQTPARNLTKLAPALVAAITAAERLMELDSAEQEEQGKAVSVAAPVGVALKNVDYAYSDRKIISNLSFDFRPGTCTAVVGHTGSGKTTLLRLLLALVKPQRGEVEIYSDLQSTFKPQRLAAFHRCNFVYVPQGNTLMSGTIRENLLLAAEDATEEMMWKALEESCADFVKELPHGLDTMCNERGGGLSEGQCQRIAIARALLRRRPVMLLDEATSALDPDTERTLLKRILGNNTHTVILITHRPAALEYCDQVLRLE